MTEDAISRYAARAVPRYTSYPTAPHFQPGLPERVYRDWLSALDPGEPVSLYLHVPFCNQMCWYCGCNMKLASRYGPVHDYLETLLAEIDLVADALPGRMQVSHLHWGGGTPTALSTEDLTRAMERVWQHFDRGVDASLAIEADPRTLTDEMVGAIGGLGFTRASFGVQEFDPKVQAAINRIQPPEMVADRVAALRDAGVAGMNFDLIYGLPHQTVATLLATIEACRPMRPDRIALFGYAHVPWMAKNQRMIPEDALPDGAERKAQANAAAAALASAGYDTIGLDHFALPSDPMARAARDGTLRRNFQGYTTDTARALIGLGATSIGRNPGGFVQNIAETGAWARTVSAGHLPIAKGVALTDDDRLRGRVIEALMCTGTADTAALGAEFGQPPDWCTAELEEMGEFARNGLVARDGGTVRLTEAGRPLMRVVAAAFDAYLGASEARHSVAV